MKSGGGFVLRRRACGGRFRQVLAGLGGWDRMALGFVLELLSGAAERRTAKTPRKPRAVGSVGSFCSFCVDGASWCAGVKESTKTPIDCAQGMRRQRGEKEKGCSVFCSGSALCLCGLDAFVAVYAL